jgi:hypothetical protein
MKMHKALMFVKSIKMIDLKFLLRDQSFKTSTRALECNKKQKKAAPYVIREMWEPADKTRAPAGPVSISWRMIARRRARLARSGWSAKGRCGKSDARRHHPAITIPALGLLMPIRVGSQATA